MATGTTSLTIHAPTPRPASSMMLNVLSTLSNASVQASQPPKPSIAASMPRPAPTTHRPPFTARQLFREKVTAAISRRVESSKSPTTFLSSPTRRLARRGNLATVPRIPLRPSVALHNAERRISLISTRERCFRTRPRPAALGKRIVSRRFPTLPENEVFPPAPAPPVLALHPLVRTKASRPLPRLRQHVSDENTVPFPTEAPALPSALPKPRRTVRAASHSLPRAPFTQISVQ